MLKRGKSIDDSNKDKRKVIHFSVWENYNLDIVKFIIELGGNINDKCDTGWKAIHCASRYNKNVI